MVQIKDKTNLRDSSHELHQEGAKSHHKIDFVLKTETERHRQIGWNEILLVLDEVCVKTYVTLSFAT